MKHLFLSGLLTLLAGNAQALVVQSPDSQIALPDRTTITSSLTMGAVDLTDLDVMLFDVKHSYLSDLEVTLTSPDDIEVALIRSTADGGIIGYGFSFDVPQIVLDDQAPDSLGTLITGQSGRFNIDHRSTGTTPLSRFNGARPAGEWTLTIADKQSGDSGTLGGWALVTTPDPEPEPAAVPLPASAYFLFGGLAALSGLQNRKTHKPGQRKA